MVWVQELYIFPEESLVTITDDLLSYHCRRKICEIAIRKVIKCNKFSLRVPSNSKSLCCKLKKKKSYSVPFYVIILLGMNVIEKICLPQETELVRKYS